MAALFLSTYNELAQSLAASPNCPWEKIARLLSFCPKLSSSQPLHGLEAVVNALESDTVLGVSYEFVGAAQVGGTQGLDERFALSEALSSMQCLCVCAGVKPL